MPEVKKNGRVTSRGWAESAPMVEIGLKVKYFRKVLLESSLSSKNRTKTRLILVKTNSFVHFLEEFMA